MLWFYKEKKYLIISLLIVLLDGIIIYFVPSFFNKINYFYPMLTITLIPFIAKDKKRLWLVILLGFIYDLLYTNIFLYNTLIFLLLGIINNKIINYFDSSIFLYIMLTVLNIIMYDSITFILVIITNYHDITINDLIYKIKHSLLLNIMSVFIYFFLFNKKHLKHKM